MLKAMKEGRGVHKGQSVKYLAKKLGRKREWVRIKRKLYFKRFTPIWKPWLSPANIKARFSRSKKELEWFKTPESKEQVIIHCDEK